MDNSTVRHNWTEADSEIFVDNSDIFVPSREEQIDTICGLIPAERNEVFTIVELGAGEGRLALATLEAYPRCRYVALDGSRVMRARLREMLSAFRDRVEIRDFKLGDAQWRAVLPQPLRCVLSSLVVHHLSADDKMRLFGDIRARLEPGGAFLIADLVKPMASKVASVFAEQWNRAAHNQSMKKRGNLRAYQEFCDSNWNYYVDKNPDPYDQPSRLFDQLLWLSEAGFKTVDCFWMRAGHAIFGGSV